MHLGFHGPLRAVASTKCHQDTLCVHALASSRIRISLDTPVTGATRLSRPASARLVPRTTPRSIHHAHAPKKVARAARNVTISGYDLQVNHELRCPQLSRLWRNASVFIFYTPAQCNTSFANWILSSASTRCVQRRTLATSATAISTQEEIIEDASNTNTYSFNSPSGEREDKIVSKASEAQDKFNTDRSYTSLNSAPEEAPSTTEASRSAKPANIVWKAAIDETIHRLDKEAGGRRRHGWLGSEEAWEETFEDLQRVSTIGRSAEKILTIILTGSNPLKVLNSALSKFAPTGERHKFGAAWFTRLASGSGHARDIVRYLQEHRFSLRQLADVEVIGSGQYLTIQARCVVAPGDDVLAKKRRLLQAKQPTVSEQGEWPQHWSKNGLESFVRDLTGAWVGTSGAKLSVDEKVDALERLFGQARRSQLEPSKKTFRSGIEFFLKHGRLQEALWTLTHSQTSGHDEDGALSQAFLSHAAKTQNLQQFKRGLNTLLARGIKPDWRSWAAFFPLIPTTQGKWRVLLEMRRRGYFDHSTAAVAVAPVFIEIAFPLALCLRMEASQYVDGLNDFFGPIWMSSTAVHGLMKKTSSSGHYRESFALLEILERKWHFQPNVIAVNTILVQLMRTRNTACAVSLIREAASRWQIKPNTYTFTMLFALARHTRHVNVARVVWKYAQMAGGTTRHMRVVVYKGLVSNKTFDRHRHLSAVVTGSVVESSSARSERTSEGSHSEAEGDASQIMAREKKVFGQMEPSQEFAQSLAEAYELDRSFIGLGYRKSRDLGWWAKNAINVPTVPVKTGAGMAERAGAYGPRKPSDAEDEREAERLNAEVRDALSDLDDEGSRTEWGADKQAGDKLE